MQSAACGRMMPALSNTGSYYEQGTETLSVFSPRAFLRAYGAYHALYVRMVDEA